MAASFFERFRARPVTLLGFGKSHRELLPCLLSAGARVTIRDRAEPEKFGLSELDRLRAQGVRCILGAEYLAELTEPEAGLVFRTPGISYTTPALAAARAQGVPFTGEIECFLENCPCPSVGVTGSDGKTTTTSLIAAMLRAGGHTTFLGGNIGMPLLPRIDGISPADRAAVELSSFQLISMRVSPDIAVVTNLSPNHLDVHADMREYVDAKRNILLWQKRESRAVLNFDCALTRALSADVRGELSYFSLAQPVERGAYLAADGMLTLVSGGRHIPLLRREELRLPGIHNVANLLAAAAACEGQAEPARIAAAAREFTGVEHRIEFVRELAGVRYYNDAIATSPSRVMAGLRAFSQKLIVIVGGYDKKIPFEPLAPALIGHARALILCGAAAPKIEAAVTAHPDYHPGAPLLLHAKDLPEAVRQAHALAVPGDIVTLSPACASFDAYPNFERKGEHYKQLVEAL